MSAGVHIGTQLHAPNGLGSLAKGVRYYYAGRRDDGKVLLVWFCRHKKKWRVHFIRMTGEDFEAALLDEKRSLKPCEKQFDWPEWLSDQEGVSFDELESSRYGKKTQTYREQVESRYAKIAPALESEKHILAADDPLKAIARYAYLGEGTMHPHRLQVWFFAYVLHGNDIWALKQPTKRVGKWNRRDETHRDVKYGRPSLDEGTSFGWSSASMRSQILKIYLDRCGPSIYMRRIHREALLEDFGCKTKKNEDGNSIYYHPENLPFPSYGQFRSVVISELGLNTVQTTVYGAPRVRNHARVNEGNYTQQFANILESLEVDAYFVSERPRAMYSNEAMPALGVARGICVTTGACVGVGFSLGSETSEAYASMLWCAAVPKALVARMYGIPLEDLLWIMQGLPASLKSDRGPAGGRKLVARLEKAFPMKSITPSYSGQSKAPVEASHPRDVNLEGAPSYVLSDLNVIQMVKREVYRACSDNHTSNISSRLSDEAIHDFRREGRTATPHHYWDYLSKRLRTSAHAMSNEQAVRAFWTEMEFPVDGDGARHRHRWYTSTAFKDVQKKVGDLTDFKVKGYVLNMVVRYIYVEVKGRLMELEATRKTRIDGQDLFVPLSELDATAHDLSILNSKTRNSIEAAAGDAEKRFKEATGKSWHQGERRHGPPKRASGTTAHEAKVTRGKNNSRRAA